MKNKQKKKEEAEDQGKIEGHESFKNDRAGKPRD